MNSENVTSKLFQALQRLEEIIREHVAHKRLLSAENIELKMTIKRLKEDIDLLRLNSMQHFSFPSPEKLLDQSATYDVDLSLNQLKSVLVRKN